MIPNICMEYGCDNPTPTPRKKRCVSCEDAHNQRLIKANNDRLQERRLAKRAADPRICQEPKCTNIVEAGSLKCKPCQDRHNKRDAEYKKRMKLKNAVEVEEETYIIPAKPKPREEVKIVKTSAQVDAECRREEARLRTVRDRLNPDLLNQRLLRGAFR
jgi:hypothetical protein